MREALKKMLLYIKKTIDVKYVQAVIYKDNQASKKLVESFGFTPFGQKIEWFRNQPYNHIIYRMKLHK
jgi:RimJ/RimL family protein N-acetyltransferase